MLPFALCLLSLCSPQQPQGPTAPPATLVTPEVRGGELAELHRLEALGTKAPTDAIAALTGSADLSIARRATWLLGRAGGRDRAVVLRDLARDSRDAEIRLHALMGLQKDVDLAAVRTAAERLADADARVRIAAAQLLGRARSDEAADELLAFVQRSARNARPESDPRDVNAALVALHDLDAVRHLLPAAEALRNSALPGTGESLAYYWQDVSPKLAKDAETTVLRAALDHREPLLRRYAIARLGELDDPAAVPALEARVGIEEAELEPLLDATLQLLRRDPVVTDGGDLERAKANLAAIAAKVQSAWHDLGRHGQLLTLGGLAGAASVLLVVALLVRRRRAAAAHAAAVAQATALVAPSADAYLETEYETDYAPLDEHDAGAEFEPYDDPDAIYEAATRNQEDDHFAHASGR